MMGQAELQVKILTNFPFERQIVGLFGENQAAMQSDATVGDMLLMITYCMKRLGTVSQDGKTKPEFIAAAINVLAAVTAEAIIQEYAEDTISARTRATQMEIGAMKAMTNQEIRSENSSELVKAVLKHMEDAARA